ncbi:MAG TPA: transglutaminaseTgpA domain-containing protein [Anaerolineae bacterium]|jgi:transglutaminase-like putative cysteine protease|nr:transglutaminaseTgpA domain-containing protein [Anaerolineae bacterium]
MLRRFRIEEGWFTVLLTWALVLIAALAIVDAELIAGTSILPFVTTLAILTGLLLAKSRFSGRTALFIALIYGLFLITFLVGRTLPGDLTWRERTFELVNRQVIWLGKAVSQSSSRDGLIFVVQTSAIFWLLGITAAWYTFRNYKVWRVVVPSGLVLLSVIYYYFGPKPLVAFLALYALLALIYIARTHLVAKERSWKAASIRYEKNIHFSFLQASFLVALIALGIAWGLPAAGANAAVSDALGETGWDDTWRGFQDNWTRLFASLRSYGTATSDPFRDTLSLGGPRAVNDSLIMDIYVEERLPFVYWQAVAYDTYDGGRWSISDSDQVLRLPDDGRFPVVDYALREHVEQNVVNYVPNAGSMYAAPGPVEADRQMFVTWSQDDNGKADIRAVQSRYVMRQGEQYGVTSYYSVADAVSLRGDSQSYPDWISAKYLQVPNEITPETRDLAAELTAEHDNPFDKAIAVRNYLRTNIGYNDQISAPPDGVEPVHYILFDRQEAYCNYYASAMIMMLRSQGIPARFVVGYTQGEWDGESSSYRVRSSNAHAWTEVFFPSYGWIPFEATASIPAGDRPDNPTNPGDAFGDEAPGEDDQRFIDPNQPVLDEERLADVLDERAFAVDAPSRGPAFFWQLGIGAFLLVAAAGVVLLFNRANRRVEGSIVRSYIRLGNWAPWLGVSVQPAHTPYERADLLSGAVPDGKEPLRNLTRQFVRQQFSRSRAPDADFDSRQEWRTLRPAMIRRTIAHQLARLQSKRPRRSKKKWQ